ncbi:MAG: S8 family peptidase, partial [Vulcanimicrobiaceae bacterium]
RTAMRTVLGRPVVQGKLESATLLLVLALAACGGGGSSSGGGGGGVVPTPVPTVVPTSTPTVAGSCTTGVPQIGGTTAPNPVGNPSSLPVSSNPSSLNVQVNGTSIGLTGLTLSPTQLPFTNFGYTITVQNSVGGSPYSVCFAQNGQLGAQVFYNQAMDTSGTVINILSIARHPLTAMHAGVMSSMVRRSPFASQSSPQRYIPGKIAVVYSQKQFGLDSSRMAGIESQVSGHLAKSFSYPRIGKTVHVVNVPTGTEDAAIATMRTQPGVLEVGRVQKRFLKSVTPSNSQYSPTPQWDMGALAGQGFPSMDLPDAWQLLQNNGGNTFGSPNVTIAVLDTGLDTSTNNTLVQQELISRVTHAESDINGATTVCSGAITGCAAVQDMDGHGTNVAGLAAASDSATAGYAGTAGDSSLQIYDIFSSGGTASTTDEATAINDAIANGANIISLSLGSCPSVGSGPDATEETAIENAIAQNVFVVAASGNERGTGGGGGCPQVLNQLDYPAAYPGVMAVGATGVDDSNQASLKEIVAWYSNSGPGLGVVAPGGTATSSTDPDTLHWIAGLYSTTGISGTPGQPPCSNFASCATLIDGTSMATPHVSGAAALIQTAYMQMNGGAMMAPSALLSLIDATADDIGDPNQGHGRVDVCRAIAIVESSGPTACPASSPTGYKPSNAQLIAFAYTNTGATNAAPTIVDQTFSGGYPVSSTGAFRIADVPTSVATFKIGVWYDANGDGKIDAGDYFGASGSCTPNTPCTSAAGITAQLVTASPFALP